MTETALLRTILEAPVQDWPRALFAACHTNELEAQFVALQMREVIAHRRREHDLANRFWAEARSLDSTDQPLFGAEALREISGVEWHEPILQRGFCESVFVDARAFLSHAPKIFEIAPITSVHLVEATGLGHDLAQSGFLERMREISVDDGFTDADLLVLLERGALKNVQHLMLRGCNVGMKSLRALAQCGGALEDLVWSQNSVPSPVEVTDWGSDMQGRWIEGFEFPDLGRELEEEFGRLRWLHAASRYGHDAPYIISILYDDEMIAAPPDWAREEIEAAGLGDLIFVPN